MKTSLLFIIPLFLVLSSNAYGKTDQTKQEKESFNNQIGLAAGLTTGNGLSYRFFLKKFGFQTTLLFLPDNENSNIGLTFLYKFIQKKHTSFYLYQSNSYSTYMTSGFMCGSPFYEWYNGLGLGVEFTLWKRIGLNFMGGLGSYENFDMINATVETGIYYKF